MRSISLLIKPVSWACNWAEAHGSYLLVGHNGDGYPCDFFVRPEWKLGNIAADPYAEIRESYGVFSLADRRVNPCAGGT